MPQRSKLTYDGCTVCAQLIGDLTLPFSTYFHGKGFTDAVWVSLAVGPDAEIEDLWIPFFCITTNSMLLPLLLADTAYGPESSCVPVSLAGCLPCAAAFLCSCFPCCAELCTRVPLFALCLCAAVSLPSTQYNVMVIVSKAQMRVERKGSINQAVRASMSIAGVVTRRSTATWPCVT